MLSDLVPRGSKHPNSRVSGTKNHSEYGFWDLKPYYLGTWTLWGSFSWGGFRPSVVRVQGLWGSTVDDTNPALPQ